MKIEIPEGFFPPPGVAFSTEAQRDLAVAMHNAGFIKAEEYPFEGADDTTLAGKGLPEHYRLAPPTPRKVGPFESHNEIGDYPTAAAMDAADAAKSAGFKKFRIHLTATAEEIL